MSRLRPTMLIVTVVAAFSITALVLFWSSGIGERAQIRARYQEMTTALSTGDTNAVLSLIAPTYRSGFDGGLLSRLEGFAKPLGPQSSILVLGHEATVWPSHIWHYCVIPGGHTVEMTKIDNKWFFTGKVHVD